jgi:hypothetical protein
MDKKPDLVVWSEENGYDAKLKPYPTNLGAFPFELPDVSGVKKKSTGKMMEVFERERIEIIEKANSLIREFEISVMVWESKISFEPIMGKTYFLYEFPSGKTLSLIAPDQWGRGDSFIGAFLLSSENKWIKVDRENSSSGSR